MLDGIIICFFECVVNCGIKRMQSSMHFFVALTPCPPAKSIYPHSS